MFAFIFTIKLQVSQFRLQLVGYVVRLIVLITHSFIVYFAIAHLSLVRKNRHIQSGVMSLKTFGTNDDCSLKSTEGTIM